MASIREHARFDTSADEIWAIVSDPVGLTEWFPGVEAAEMVRDDARRVELAGGIGIVETIVTNDDDLRRFQYAITEAPMPVESHLATIDVLEDGDGAIVVYSIEIKPDEGAALMGPVATSALDGLKQHLST